MQKTEDYQKLRNKIVKELANLYVKQCQLEFELRNIEQAIWDKEHDWKNVEYNEAKRLYGEKTNDLLGSN